MAVVVGKGERGKPPLLSLLHNGGGWEGLEKSLFAGREVKQTVASEEPGR